MAGDRYHGQSRHDRDDHRDNRDSNRSSGGRYNKKRKHHGERDGGDDQTSHTMGVGSTLALLKQPELPEFNLIAGENSKAESGGNKDADVDTPQDWEAVEGRPAKKAKKIPKSHSSNYPSITFSSDSRLQSQIKISDLQGLVLYLTADGTSPQWVSVRHRPQIRKVVVLMVPGLEKKDFKLEDSNLAEEDISLDSREECKKRTRDYDSSLEDYHPKTLLAEKLPSHMRLFSEMFDHLWPVKTPGDDKYSKMHSPLHAMLSAPLPKNQDDKNKKGVKSAREPQGWQNNRTRITEYISSSEDLLENEYTLHPALYDNEADKTALQEQRNLAATSMQHGWVDTVVEKIADSEVAEENIESGSMLAGRKIYAMDCEMCKTGEQEFSLTRISLVNWDGSVELDELVKPDKPIIDYLTQ
jgi:RNA exonuclease 1